MRIHVTQLVQAFLLGCLAAAAQAHASPAHAASVASVAWIKDYASGCPGNQTPCPASPRGRENALNWDPRFLPLLKKSFRQQQHWWTGRSGTAPVSGMVQTFLGVPGDVFLDDDRFVTATGCVPHDCLDTGLLWIDTGSHPATLVFVATDAIHNITGESATHLWLYTSTHLDFSNLPPDLLKNLDRWHTAHSPPRFPMNVPMATLVQPNGLSTDLTWDTLFYQQNQPHFPKTGAQQ
jgi:hypothetical protein